MDDGGRNHETVADGDDDDGRIAFGDKSSEQQPVIEFA